VAADDIGERGQWLFCLLMTQIGPDRNEPYFRSRFLGDKYPIFDYLVELLSMNGPRQAGIGGLPTRHPLHCVNLQRLWQEVRDFWASRNTVLTGSHFV
jgi:hypothetical protein